MPRKNKIIIRTGTGAPSASDFVTGEPAFDSSAGSLYIKNAAGDMAQITGGGGGGGTVSGTVTIPNLGDPSYSSVALLLHGTGTNGSTTFTDSSPSPKTVTVSAGSPQISTAQSKFGSSSIHLPDTARIVTPSSSDFAFGTGDFTVEFWWYVVTLPTTEARLVTFGQDANSYLNLTYGYSSNTFTIVNEAVAHILNTSQSVSLNQWHHLAYTRASNTLRLFFNGALLGTTDVSGVSTPATSAAFSSGPGGNSYFDEIRITKGVARYTSAFTPPSAVFPDASSLTLPLNITGSGGGGGSGSVDVYEFATPADFPAVGSAAVVYIATDSSRLYRWTGSTYMELGPIGSDVDSLLRSLLVPPAPTSVTATAGNAQAAVSWVAPTVLSQTAISDYIIQYSSNSGSTWTTFTDATSTATSATVTGLTNGTAYVFRVAAVNAVGTGSYSAASSAVTPSAGTPPGAPTGLTATAGNAQISLAWTAPSSVGSSAITGYSVEYTPSGGSPTTVNTGSTATSYTLTGLTNGTAYTARVAAVNAAGTGTYTAASSSVTPSAASVPGAPRSITVTPCGCGYATISWLAPLSDGGSAVTSYRLRASLNNYATFRAVAAPSLSTGCLYGSNVISGVDFNNPSWVLRIYAVNAIGESSSYAEFTENNGAGNSFGGDCG